MFDALHLFGYYILARIMLILAIPIAGVIGIVTIFTVALILKPRETARLIVDDTFGRLSRWQKKHVRKG